MQERTGVDHRNAEERAKLATYQGGQAEWDMAIVWLHANESVSDTKQDEDNDQEDDVVYDEETVNEEREAQRARLVCFFDKHIPGGITPAVNTRIEGPLNAHHRKRDYDIMWQDLTSSFGPEPAPPVSNAGNVKYTGLFDRYLAPHSSDDIDLARSVRSTETQGIAQWHLHATPVPEQSSQFQPPKVSSFMHVHVRLEQAPTRAYNETR